MPRIASVVGNMSQDASSSDSGSGMTRSESTTAESTAIGPRTPNPEGAHAVASRSDAITRRTKEDAKRSRHR
jgi:hypothetical protein